MTDCKEQGAKLEKQLKRQMLSTLIGVTEGKIKKESIKLSEMEEDLVFYKGQLEKITKSDTVVHARIKVLESDIKMWKHLGANLEQGVEFLKDLKKAL